MQEASELPLNEEFNHASENADSAPLCSCGKDPYSALPPEIRPRQRDGMAGLRKVACPACGLVYWTNRKTDICMNCEMK